MSKVRGALVFVACMLAGAAAMYLLGYLTGSTDHPKVGAVCSITEDGELTDCTSGKPLDYKDGKWSARN